MSNKYFIEEEIGKNEKTEKFIKENGTVFHQYDFLVAVGNEYICYIVKTRISDEIIGVLPLVKTIKFGLKGFHIPPFAYQFGPIINSININEADQILSMLLNVLEKEKQIDFKIIINNGNVLPYKNLKFSIEANQSHIFNFKKEFGQNELTKDKKRDVRKLLNLIDHKEIEIIENTDLVLKHLIALWQITSKRAKFEPHINLLENILNSDIPFYSNAVLDRNKNPLAATFCPLDKNTMYHLVGASKRVNDKILSRANIISLYFAIKNANNSGLNFDFEGSNISGVADFYRSMGGQPIVIHRIQKTKSFYYSVLKGIKKVI